MPKMDILFDRCLKNTCLFCIFFFFFFPSVSSLVGLISSKWLVTVISQTHTQFTSTGLEGLIFYLFKFKVCLEILVLVNCGYFLWYLCI